MYNALLGGALVVPFVLGAVAAPADRVEVAFTFTDPEIVESSGLAIVGDTVVTTNDSGDSGRVFVVDPASGDTVRVVSWADEPTDVEALAADGETVWVGDIGDNGAERDFVQVTPVPVVGGVAAAPTYDLTYPRGPVDAESLLVHPTTGRVYVASKEVLGGTLYEAPADLAEGTNNRLQPVGPVLPLATDGAFFPDGRHLVLRNYGQAEIYSFPELERVATLDLPRQPQGEGITVDSRDRLLLSSEGVDSEVLRLTLPRDVRELLDPSPPASPSPSESATPQSEAPQTESREDSELPASTRTERPLWPWLLSGLIGLGIGVVLIRSLRRPR